MGAVHNLYGDRQYCAIVCSNCGVEFLVPTGYHTQLVDKRKIFHCPNGHQQVYADSEVARLEKEVKALKEKADKALQWLEQERKAHARTRKRHAGAVCPCCNRTFSQLTRHMKTKHPGYQAL